MPAVSAEAEKARSAISPAAEKLASYTATRMLEQTPVEELNRDKRGIRVKALHDAGFDTIADVLRAPLWELASCKGISDEGAGEIKALAGQFCEAAVASVKLKLSADDRSAEADALIACIYRHRLLKGSQDGIKRFRRTDAPRISDECRKLAAYDAAVWLISDAEARKPAYELAISLQESLDGEEARQIEAGIAALRDGAVDVEAAWRDFSRTPVAYFNTIEEVAPGLLGNNDSLYGLTEEMARAIQDECFFPDGLLCTLRRYQEWGVKYILHQEKVLLGDEMGLGKTIQAIAAMVSLKNCKASHFIVVCPASVLTNWCREITRHSMLRAIKVYGRGVRENAFRSWIATGGVAVTTYETVGSLDFSEVGTIDMVIVDEAHYIKNPEANRSKNVRAICRKSQRNLLMTGTALENKVGEMISLIELLNPEVAGRLKANTSLGSAEQFRRIAAEVYYRRKREDVLTELPELIESREWCSLGAEEERAYEDAILARKYAEARRVSWNVGDLQYSSKARRLMQICDDALEQGRKVVVFTFFLETLRSVVDLLGTRCVGFINGSVSVPQRQVIIDGFNDAPDGSVLAAQILAGGTGLNIQSASVVVICEPQFKPSIENQAISRAYRMGQTRNVMVYRLLCEGTVDERLIDILERKQREFDAFADKSVAAEVAELDDRGFKKIIEEEIDRIKEKRGIEDEGVEAEVRFEVPAEAAVPESGVDDMVVDEPDVSDEVDMPPDFGQLEPNLEAEVEHEAPPVTVNEAPDLPRDGNVVERPIRFCPYCGEKVPQQPVNFCSWCGEKLRRG